LLTRGPSYTLTSHGNCLAGALKKGDVFRYRGHLGSCECWLKVTKVKETFVRCRTVKRCGQDGCHFSRSGCGDVGRMKWVTPITDSLATALEEAFGS
jgi:hypothetical protein